MVNRSIPILLYHSVAENPSEWIARWTLSPAMFEEHLDVIVETGMTPLTVSELVSLRVAGRALPERPVVVTFDDGFSDFYSEAAPRMRARGIVGTIYVITGALTCARAEWSLRLPLSRMLEAEQLKELEDMGMEIGAHTETHPQLDAIPFRSARSEIIGSKGALEDALGHEVNSFAYPHGYSNARVRAAVVEAGFESACGVRNAFSSETDNLFALARLTVERNTSLPLLRAWLRGEQASAASPHERYATRIWRSYRRAAGTLRRDRLRVTLGHEPISSLTVLSPSSPVTAQPVAGQPVARQFASGHRDSDHRDFSQ